MTKVYVPIGEIIDVEGDNLAEALRAGGVEVTTENEEELKARSEGVKARNEIEELLYNPKVLEHLKEIVGEK